jgi:hypothetical protein
MEIKTEFENLKQLFCVAPETATPTTRLATEIVPSLAPKTAARSQPILSDLWDSL